MSRVPKACRLSAAVVQSGSVAFDSAACVNKGVRLIGEAAATGATIIDFPEAFIGGYPKGLSYSFVVGARDPAGREEFLRSFESAIDVPGPETARLGLAAAASSCCVVIGVIDRDGGTCYCTDRKSVV